MARRKEGKDKSKKRKGERVRKRERQRERRREREGEKEKKSNSKGERESKSKREKRMIKIQMNDVRENLLAHIRTYHLFSKVENTDFGPVSQSNPEQKLKWQNQWKSRIVLY